jgi:hypothetical protein
VIGFAAVSGSLYFHSVSSVQSESRRLGFQNCRYQRVPTMNQSKLERRMAELELEVSSLRSQMDKISSTVPWWERIAGTFNNDPIYRQAMKLGQQFRKAQKSIPI